MKAIIVSLMLSSAVSIILGQESAPLVTDRPDQTESSETVPKHSFQIETGFAWEKDERVFGCENTKLLFSVVNGTLFRYGLTDWLELRLEGQVAFERTQLCDGIKENHFGATGMGVGFKVHLWKEKGLLPDAGLIAGVDIPVSGLPVCDLDHTSEKMESGFLFAFAHTLSSVFSFGYNLGAAFLDEGTDLIYSAALGIGLSERLGTFIEVYGVKAPDVAASLFFDAGMTFLIRPNLQWDVSFGVAVTDDAPEGFVSTGVSIRLPE